MNLNKFSPNNLNVHVLIQIFFLLIKMSRGFRVFQNQSQKNVRDQKHTQFLIVARVRFLILVYRVYVVKNLNFEQINETTTRY